MKIYVLQERDVLDSHSIITGAYSSLDAAKAKIDELYQPYETIYAIDYPYPDVALSMKVLSKDKHDGSEITMVFTVFELEMDD